MINETPSGIICIDKPAGMTSFDCVNKIRRLYNTKKVGHTGTLDPMATGLLVVLLGNALKAEQYITSLTKRYTAGIRFGIETDTEDTTGTVTQSSDTLPTFAQFEECAKLFVGESMQTPPMYSAVKIGGKKLYELAREGITIEREARPITVHSLRCIKTSDLDPTADAAFDLCCSKGTYVRTLCSDIGKKLGCYAAMSSLRRTENGKFTLKDAHTLEELESMSYENRLALLLPCEFAFNDTPVVDLPDFFAKLAQCGNRIYLKKIGKANAFTEGELLRLYNRGSFFALAKVVLYEGDMTAKPVIQIQ